MSDVNIEILENGFEVSYDDPEIRAANNAPSKGNNTTPWKDPRKGYVFKTAEEVATFLGKLLPKLEPSDDDATEFSKAFSTAVSKED